MTRLSCIVAVLLLPAWVGRASQVDMDLRALTRAPHRLAGTAEGAQAAAHIEAQLRDMGLDPVIVQPFRTTQTRIKRCEMVFADGGSKALLPMRPNGVIPPVSPAAGVAGPIVHVLSRQAFESRDVRGAIVVMDYNAGDGWMMAFRLGAKAVVFTRSKECRAWHSHYVEGNANLLRFYYAGPIADLPEGAEVTIHSEVVWAPGIGRNVMGFVQGTDPVFGREKAEVIVLSASYDSFGEVPHASPGARGAANCAALLRLARTFSKQPPRRDVLLLFLDSQARCQEGARVFYRALETGKHVKGEDRAKSIEQEVAFIAEIRRILEHPERFRLPSDVRLPILTRLGSRAMAHKFSVDARILEKNVELQSLRDAAKEGVGDCTARDARIESLARTLEGELREEKDDWNDVRRALGRTKRGSGGDETLAMQGGAKAKMARIMREELAAVASRGQEVALARDAVDADMSIAELLGAKWIVLHASLLLGDSMPRWGVVVGGDSPCRSSEDVRGFYVKILAAFARAHRWLNENGTPPQRFLVSSVDGSISPTRELWPGSHLVHAGEVAGLFGIYNVGLATCQDAMPREGTPDDRLETLSIARIMAQADEIGQMLSAVADMDTGIEQGPDIMPARETIADQEALSLHRGILPDKDYHMARFDNGKTLGPTVMGTLPGSTMPDSVMPGAIVHYRLNRDVASVFDNHKSSAFDPGMVIQADCNGSFSLGPVPKAVRRGGLGMAFTFDERGEVAYASDTLSRRCCWRRINVFRARGGVLVLPPQATGDQRAGTVRALSGRTDAALDDDKHLVEDGEGVVAWFSEWREPNVKLVSTRTLMALNNGGELLVSTPPTVKASGQGFEITNAWHQVNAAQRSAADLWRLNESRLSVLKGRHIRDQALAELHGRSQDLLLDAAESDSPLRRESLSACSFMASQPVYRSIRKSYDDLVVAILILLGFSVPFAFAMERIVIGATTIYRQITGFVVFFAATFLLLYLSHPAFAIASTPIIIFLGFTIVVMSGLVISIIMRKFEAELRLLRGMQSVSHVSAVSRVSTFMAAMQMGISTMRRRPLRTALTAITTTLLTFTILCFASFSVQLGTVKLFKAQKPDYSGVMIRQLSWGSLSPDLLTVVEQRWRGRATVFPRYWHSPADEFAPGVLVTAVDGAKSVGVRGVLGLTAGELSERADIRRLIPELNDDRVYVTRTVAEAMGLVEGDDVVVGGQRLVLGKPLDPGVASLIVDMDQSSILPVDFGQTPPDQAARSDEAEVDSEVQMTAEARWASLSPDAVVITSDRAARILGGQLRAIMMYTPDADRAIEIAEDLARMLPFPVAATRHDGTYRHVLGTVLAASGVQDLLFPILLGGLVIFGTMLASVADREREIYTFSALGLAPRDVGTLFFAEAMVYSLIGGMGGYLLAQVTVKVLTILSTTTGLRVPEMNMSSTNTIVTMLIVMVTVLVSAIYPGIRASRSANPGLMRSWALPEPDGDALDIVFPFTVSDYDITGVVSFLQEHFMNHADSGVGEFMASDIGLVKGADGHLGLAATVAIAPFDLGVSERFVLGSSESEIPGIDEVTLRLERLSGQPKDWCRLNKALMDDLRQQFLLWRSMPHDKMEVYRHRTLVEFGAAHDGDEPPPEPRQG